MSRSTDTISRTIPVSSLTPQAVCWLWLYRFGLGRLVLLDGDPGLGKSLLALDFCARVSTGRAFPGDALAGEPANALVINGEDGQNDSIAPRLQALGANLQRVFVLDSNRSASTLVLRLPSKLDVLQHALQETRPRLVVIDPIVAFLDPTVQLNNESSVRQALAPLADLARQHDCVILLIRHLNKSTSFRALYRGAHSIGFQAACRSCWLLVPDPLQGGRCVLAQVKNNEAPPQASLKVSLTVTAGQLPTVHWLGEHPWSADALLHVTGRPPRVCLALEKAREFLTTYLKEGSRTSRDVWQAARGQRFSRATLQRAREQLNITFKKLWVDGTRLSYWLLPGQQLPPDVAARYAEQDLEPWLGPMRQQFPPPSPLDDR
jgi:putative DNA primase/helicase